MSAVLIMLDYENLAANINLVNRILCKQVLQVSKQNQDILKLKTELIIMHEQYQVMKEKNEMNCGEIEKLKQKLKSNPTVLKVLKETSDQLGAQVFR